MILDSLAMMCVYLDDNKWNDLKLGLSETDLMTSLMMKTNGNNN